MQRRLEGQYKEPIFGEDFDRSYTRPDRKWERGVKVKNELESQLVEAGIAEEQLANAYPENGVPMNIAKTLAVLALMRGISNPDAPLPYPFSDEVRAIQVDLLASIRIIGHREKIGTRIEEELRNLLDPEYDVTCFKRKLIRWLIDYLMECSEIGRISESLKTAISIITNPENQPVPRRRRTSNDKMKGRGQKAKKPVKSRNKMKEVLRRISKKDTVDVPSVEEITEESKKAKRPKKLLKKSKKKVEEEQRNSVNYEADDKSKEEEQIDVVPVSDDDEDYYDNLPISQTFRINSKPKKSEPEDGSPGDDDDDDTPINVLFKIKNRPKKREREDDLSDSDDDDVPIGKVLKIN
ncbi:hypothetical protein C5167_026976 [Papaver somniferum]|nr:hypothetical protein C5167_026976 [Papaver somniferum]